MKKFWLEDVLGVELYWLRQTVLRQLLCQHSFHLNRWHWCHGPNGNDPHMIECEYRCSKCGKLTYRDLSDDRKNMKIWADLHRDKEWRWKNDSQRAQREVG